MSTNYYVKTGRKEKVICNYGCEHEIDEELHLGKFSLGWKFCLHIIPEKNINELEDWKKIMQNGTIIDEYGQIIQYDYIIDLILNNNYNDCEDMSTYTPEPYCAYDKRDNSFYCIKDTIGKESISYVLVEGEFC